MTQPRIVPGMTHLVTRRTNRRHLLFDGCGDQSAFIYCLAVARRSTASSLRGRAHVRPLTLVLTDLLAGCPLNQELNRLFALVTRSCASGRFGLGSRAPSIVELSTPRPSLRDGYVLANPWKRARPHRLEWPASPSGGGPRSLRPPCHTPYVFFDPENPSGPQRSHWPSHSRRCFPIWHRDEIRAMVADELQALERGRAPKTLPRAEGACRRQSPVSPYDRARAANRSASATRNRRRPVSAKQCGSRQLLRAFREAIATPSSAGARIRDVVFPKGTWWMRIWHQVGVEQ